MSISIQYEIICTCGDHIELKPVKIIEKIDYMLLAGVCLGCNKLFNLRIDSLDKPPEIIK